MRLLILMERSCLWKSCQFCYHSDRRPDTTVLGIAVKRLYGIATVKCGSSWLPARLVFVGLRADGTVEVNIFELKCEGTVTGSES